MPEKPNIMKKSAFLILVALAGGISSCGSRGGNSAPGDAPVPVNVITLAPEHVVYYDSYPAYISALKEVEIRGDVTGYVTGIYFEEGKAVRQGQKLYEIDRSRYMASFEEAKANVEIAKANLDKATQDYDRYAELSRQDAIAKQKLDYAATELRNAKLQVDKANAGQVKAKAELDYSLITAPFDGTIGISRVRLGTLISPGQTLLNTISSDDPVCADIEIGEKEYPRFRELETKDPATIDSSFRLIMPDNSPYPLSGRIGIIDRAVNQQTGTIKVRLNFPNPGRRLIPGMNCKIKVKNELSGSVILIPSKAVVEQMGEFFVFLDKGDKAAQVKITPGVHIGDKVIVENGLSPGDEVVTDGIQKLRDGSSLTTKMPDQKNNNTGGR